jgi:hypothetical protein
MLTCPVDREDGPNPFALLRDWEVRPLHTDDVPAAGDAEKAYFVANERIGVEEPFSKRVDSIALARKSEDGPWHFGLVQGLKPDELTELAKDACRLITGHRHGYDVKFTDGWLTPSGGGLLYRWSHVLHS